MRRRDASLVFFTTLTQWSVGITIWLAVWQWTDIAPSGTFATGWDAGNPVLLALALVGSATLVSFLHLGKPANARHATNNLENSWLSREILALGLYSLGLAAWLTARWLEPGGASGAVLSLAVPTVGLFLLWTMTRVYTVATIPAWNSGHTPLSFAATSLCLGLLTLIILGMVQSSGPRGLTLGLLCTILFLEAVSAILNQSRLATLSPGIAGSMVTREGYRRVFRFRMALLLTACGLALFLAVQPGAGSSAAWLVVLAILVLGQELAGRVLFYSSYFRLGL